MIPRVGDTVSFIMNRKIVTGEVTWVGFCGIDVQLNENDVESIGFEEIMPNPKLKEGTK